MFGLVTSIVSRFGGGCNRLTDAELEAVPLNGDSGKPLIVKGDQWFGES